MAGRTSTVFPLPLDRPDPDNLQKADVEALKIVPEGAGIRKNGSWPGTILPRYQPGTALSDQVIRRAESSAAISVGEVRRAHAQGGISGGYSSAWPLGPYQERHRDMKLGSSGLKGS
ncbi:hypothetical protein NPIL_636091 [Nephila pilipes]|uniref:Uncharacterized protein n=1 Tax=Nephila pilipes TaxID=299642 RepID=A0A8X6P7H8_NEPPI|nr:hypothetical protein NPIL_636091 [Nephila pilipes]